MLTQEQKNKADKVFQEAEALTREIPGSAVLAVLVTGDTAEPEYPYVAAGPAKCLLEAALQAVDIVMNEKSTNPEFRPMLRLFMSDVLDGTPADVAAEDFREALAARKTSKE